MSAHLEADARGQPVLAPPMTAPGSESRAGRMQPGSPTIDLALVRAVATETNRAHRGMGTELLDVEGRGVTIALAWRDDLAEPAGGLAPGVLAAMLDHACSLAALVVLDDPARFGGTISLRVDYLEAARAGCAVHAHAEAVHEGSRVVSLRGSTFHPDDPRRPLATAVCTVAAETA